MTRSCESGTFTKIVSAGIYCALLALFFASSWEDDRPSYPGTLPFRNDQLIFRRHEIYLAYSAFHSLVDHDHYAETLRLQTIDGSPIEWESWSKLTADGLARVKCDANVALVGHSFGGASVVCLSLLVVLYR